MAQVLTTLLHCTAPSYLNNYTLNCTALNCTALNCTELNCTALNCTALNCLFSQYNKLERPVPNETQAIVLKFGLTLQQIMDVVSLTETVHLTPATLATLATLNMHCNALPDFNILQHNTFYHTPMNALQCMTIYLSVLNHNCMQKYQISKCEHQQFFKARYYPITTKKRGQCKLSLRKVNSTDANTTGMLECGLSQTKPKPTMRIH